MKFGAQKKTDDHNRYFWKKYIEDGFELYPITILKSGYNKTLLGRTSCE